MLYKYYVYRIVVYTVHDASIGWITIFQPSMVLARMQLGDCNPL